MAVGFLTLTVSQCVTTLTNAPRKYQATSLATLYFFVGVTLVSNLANIRQNKSAKTWLMTSDISFQK